MSDNPDLPLDTKIGYPFEKLLLSQFVMNASFLKLYFLNNFGLGQREGLFLLRLNCNKGVTIITSKKGLKLLNRFDFGIYYFYFISELRSQVESVKI